MDQVPRKNRKVVVCTIAGRVGQVTVRVRDNVNFMVGMEVGDAYEGSDGVWVKDGVGPRRRGKW